MANRVPIVLDAINKQLEELPNGDDLDLTGNSVIGVSDITASGTIDAASLTVNGVPVGTNAFSGDYADLTNKPAIPTNLSELANDVGFITSETDSQTLGLVGNSLSISGGNTINLAPIIPTNITSFTNDAGYLTSIISESIYDLNDVELSIDSTAPTDGQALVYDSLNEVWTNRDILVNETDTLDTVTSRGATTDNDLSIGNLTANTVFFNELDVTGTGTVTIEAATNLILDAVNAVVVQSSPFRVASFTTAERDNLTPSNGDIIYNTDTSKFQGYYANTAWADLH